MTKIEEIEWKLDTLTKMYKNAKEDYEKISNDLNECQKALAELKESKKEGKWKPKDDEEYWFRTTDGQYIGCKRTVGVGCDDWRAHYTPIFKSEEECGRYWHFMDTVKEKSYEFSKEEWENTDVEKYIINYDFYVKAFNVDNYCCLKKIGTIYFKTEADAQYIIDNFKDELFEFWL